MMRGTFTWKGVRGDPDTTTVFGVEFARGEPTDVELEDDLFERLKSNPCFKFHGLHASSQDALDEKAELKALLFQKGVSVDGRWSVERMKKELEKVRNPQKIDDDDVKTDEGESDGEAT